MSKQIWFATVRSTGNRSDPHFQWAMCLNTLSSPSKILEYTNQSTMLFQAEIPLSFLRWAASFQCGAQGSDHEPICDLPMSTTSTTMMQQSCQKAPLESWLKIRVLRLVSYDVENTVFVSHVQPDHQRKIQRKPNYSRMASYLSGL